MLHFSLRMSKAGLHPCQEQKLPEAAHRTHLRLTPPATPIIHSNHKSEPDLDRDSCHSLERIPLENAEVQIPQQRHPYGCTPCRPLGFLYDLQISQDGNGRDIEYGRGAWSIVKQATSRWEISTPGSTPPPSPETANRLLAVKCPHRRDAHSILAAEASILTRISQAVRSEEYVIPFYGYIPSSHSIVMCAVPLALSTVIENSATAARENLTTKSMFEPVFGHRRWQDLATRLISGLTWLHNEACVVHGDVKPQNILLRSWRDRTLTDAKSCEEDIFPYDPLFADFSSARVLSLDPPKDLRLDTSSGLNTFSALTPPYAAPELLSVIALKNPDTHVTTASDVFSTAATLLSAATGDLLLYSGSSNMQRLAMAREGHLILDFVRSGANGSRVPRNGIVDALLKPGVKKDPAERIDAAGWLRTMNASRQPEIHV